MGKAAPEEDPGGDELLSGTPGRFLHDVDVGGVEAQGGGGRAISHQIHPQQLHGQGKFMLLPSMLQAQPESLPYMSKLHRPSLQERSTGGQSISPIFKGDPSCHRINMCEKMSTQVGIRGKEQRSQFAGGMLYSLDTIQDKRRALCLPSSQL